MRHAAGPDRTGEGWLGGLVGDGAEDVEESARAGGEEHSVVDVDGCQCSDWGCGN